MAQQDKIAAQGGAEDTSRELPQVTHTDQSFDVDLLLDDIDSILETDATAFVQGFVQKGGQ